MPLLIRENRNRCDARRAWRRPPRFGLPPDGTWPMGTTRWEKRNIAKRYPSGKRNSVPNVTTVSPLPTLSYSRKSGTA